MEHRLIQGGEQFLPFARSCVAKLKKLGLSYADQSHEVDGVSIKVRIEPGHEYIRIEGGSVSLSMDSGAVDVLSIAEFNAATFLPGVLYAAGSALAYTAPFVYDPANTPGRTKKPTAAKDPGQLAGVITKKSWFAGRILDGAASFAPGEASAIPATDPATKTPDLHDDLLRSKKMVGVLCPPSIFTGRCRLYVQAMYGLPLYEYNKNGGLSKTNAPPAIVNETSAAPALMIKPYVEYGDAETYQDVLLDTSCGVWLDAETGKHWLFQLSSRIVTIYPLMSNPAGEKLRSYLVARASGYELNDTDRAHLEAYILSRCLPNVRRKQIASGAFTCGTYSMGYGWHWNFDGNTADIVVSSQFEQAPIGAGNYAMVSTHLRMSIAKTAVAEPLGGFSSDAFRQTWDAQVTTVEGPSEWSVYRYVWCITEPNYAPSVMVLEKTTPQRSLIFPCSAPFYAYYVGNDLKVCRVSVEYEAPGVPKRTMSEGFAASLTYQANDVSYSTLGEHDGWLEERSNSGWSYNARFSCGSLVTPTLKGVHTNTGFRIDLTGNQIAGWNLQYTYPGMWYGKEFLTGYPPYASTVVNVGSYSTYSGLSAYKLLTVSFTETEHGYAEVVVPFYDSEACYIRHSVRKVRENNGTLKLMNASNLGGYNYATREVASVYLGGNEYGTAEFIRYGWNAGGPASGASVSSSSPVNDSVTTEADDRASLVCVGGTLPATFTHLSEFHDNTADFVGAEFGTISSAYQNTPVVISPGYISPLNAGVNMSVPVIVGWV